MRDRTYSKWRTCGLDLLLGESQSRPLNISFLTVTFNILHERLLEPLQASGRLYVVAIGRRTGRSRILLPLVYQDRLFHQKRHSLEYPREPGCACIEADLQSTNERNNHGTIWAQGKLNKSYERGISNDQ